MIYKFLPNKISIPLFGDRKKWGIKTDKNDVDFKDWQANYIKFYEQNQKGIIGNVVNGFGFKIVANVDFTNKTILEVGPGIIQHTEFGDYRKCKKYWLADINISFLDKSKLVLQEHGVNDVEEVLVKELDLSLPDDSVDVIITFHQLEHIYYLESYLEELKRVLKPGGLLIGAVPTEGGLAWGFGRFLTSRRYVKNNMSFDYDKVICWEHPNFVDKIKNLLDAKFERVKQVKKPLGLLPFDLNLSWSFIYKNTK